MDNLIHADCLDAMAAMDAESVDAIVTDPPYGLEFMGMAWDTMREGGTPRTRNEWADFGSREHARTADDAPRIRRNKGLALQQFSEAWAREAFRIAKPGVHLLAFGGTRTVHRLAAAIEDAGWEIRDMLVWGYASGFPKSLDVSKAIDKARDDKPDVRRVCAFLRDAHRANPRPRVEIDAHFGTKNIGGHWFTPDSPLAGCPTWDQWTWLRSWLGFGDEMDAEVWRLNGRKGKPGDSWERREITREEARPLVSGEVIGFDQRMSDERERRDIPATPDAEKWNGWGTALKPAWEPIVMARKPLRGTVAANVLRHGTGALNIDGTRIGTDTERGDRYGSGAPQGGGATIQFGDRSEPWSVPAGRWPANVILTDPIFDGGVEGVVGGGENRGDWVRSERDFSGWEKHGELVPQEPRLGDSGTYSRFFLIPKSARAEREPVLGGHGLTEGPRVLNSGSSGRTLVDGEWVETHSTPRTRANVHPTVKPLDLMRHLVRLVTPPGGTVLDPFLGSGTTALAAEMEGFAWIGIEKEAEYVAITEARLNGTQMGLGLDVGAPTRKPPHERGTVIGGNKLGEHFGAFREGEDIA